MRQAQAFRDNLVLDYAGLKAAELNDKQRAMLVDVIGEYVGNMVGRPRARSGWRK